MKKRALALVCAFAMGMTMCAGTNVSNTAKAAADGGTEAVENEGTDVSVTETVTTPKVRIVGATISNQNAATQSLRFLMEVENYDQIKVSKGQDFGINLTVADKTVPVTYKKYKEIYAINKTSNTLQYAVEINGINSDNIDTNITAQGFVTGLPSGGETVDNAAISEKATRSVSGVATEAGYKITVDKNNNNYMTLNKNFDTGCSLDLTKAQVLYGDGTIERDSFSGIKAKNVQGIAVPIHDKGFVAGSEVEVTIHGTASGSSRVRAYIEQSGTMATEINEDVTMNSVFILEITASADSSVLFIKAPYKETFAELNISKIDVKVLPMLFEKPTEASEPYTLEFNDETVKGSWGGNAVINNNKTVTGRITNQYGYFEFDLPDNLVSKYYDTVTVKFKEANYQGNTIADIWMSLDTVNNGLLTNEHEYVDRFNHVAEGEAVITAKSGPIKNVRISTGDKAPTSDKPFTFIIESVIFSNSKWINPDDVKAEYELELNKENVVAVNKLVALTFNDDKSVTIETTGTDPNSNAGPEFGFKIPRNIYQANNFRKIIISYKDSDLMEYSHHTQHFGTDNVGWIPKDNPKWNGTPMMGTGTVTLDLDPATEDGNFSNMRFFDLPKVDGKKMTITSVKLTK